MCCFLHECLDAFCFWNAQKGMWNHSTLSVFSTEVYCFPTIKMNYNLIFATLKQYITIPTNSISINQFDTSYSSEIPIIYWVREDNKTVTN